MIIKHVLISVSFPVLMQDWAMVPLQVSFRLMNRSVCFRLIWYMKPKEITFSLILFLINNDFY